MSAQRDAVGRQLCTKIYFVQILERNGNNEHTQDPSQTGRCGHAAVSLLRCQRNSLTFWKRRVFVFRQRTRSGMMDGHQLQVFRASGVRFLLSKPAGFSEGCTLQNNAEHFPSLEQDSIKKTHRSICFSFRAVTLLCVGLVFSVQVGDSDISCFNNKVVLHIY